MYRLFVVLVAGCGAPGMSSPDLAPACTLERELVGGECRPRAGQLCGPCGPECTAAGGICVMDGCATPCDDSRNFCPRGYRCDDKHCVSSLDAGCSGCYEDGDCGGGEVCNLNNKKCVPAPTGPDARLEMSALDFVYDDMGVEMRARNLTWSLGFFTTRDPSFDPYGLAAGTCGSQRSTLSENAPFPVGPLRDAGATLTLALPQKMVTFDRTLEDDPKFGYTYSTFGLMVADFVAGAASWSGTGGAEVGAFNAAGTIPADFTTTPDVLDGVQVKGDVTIAFSAGSEDGWLEVSWNEFSGNTVTALTRIACRASGDSVTIPSAMLVDVPRNSAVSLTATRASVRDFTATGLQQGRVVFTVQKAGTLVLLP
jgi:hypothetical protein